MSAFQAAPSITYFTDRFPRYADRLKSDLGLTDAHIDELVAGGEKYRGAYDEGIYGYRLLVFEAPPP